MDNLPAVCRAAHNITREGGSMDRRELLKNACGLGVCGCVLGALDPSDVSAAATAQAPDQRLAFARYQVATMVGLFG